MKKIILLMLMTSTSLGSLFGQEYTERVSGLISSSKSGTSDTTFFNYDEQGRVIEVLDLAETDGSRTTVNYSTIKNEASISYQDRDTTVKNSIAWLPVDLKEVKVFDDNNQLVEFDVFGGSGNPISKQIEKSEIIYENSKRSYVVKANRNNIFVSKYEYNPIGDLTSVTDFQLNDAVKSQKYIDGLSDKDTLIFDIEIETNKSSRTVYTYNSNGWLEKEQDQNYNNMSWTNSDTTAYQYDVNGNNVKTTTRWGEDVYTFDVNVSSSTINYEVFELFNEDAVPGRINPNKLLTESYYKDGALESSTTYLYETIVPDNQSQTIIFPLSTEAVLSNGDKGQLLSAFAQDKDNVKTNLPITYEIVSGQEVGFIRNDSLVYTGVTGIVKIKAIQVGNDSYEATEKVIEVEVKQFDNLQTQFLIFSTLETGILEFDFGQKMSAFTENNQGTNTGLPVTYELVSGEDVAFIRNDSLIYKGVVGDVVIKASQVGDETYAAVSKEQTVAVKKFEIVHNSPLCQNELLSCKPTTINNVVYEWVKPGGRKIRKQEFTIYPIKQADSGLYILKVIRTKDTLTFEVEVDVKLPAEEVFMQTLETGECEDKKYEFNVLGKYKTFEWYLNNTLIDTTVVPNLTPSFTGIYHVVAEDSNSCTSQSSSFYLDLTPDSLPIIRYDLATNSLEVTNSETYQWYVNELFIVDQTSRQLPLLVNGEYQVTTTNKEGCVFISKPFTVSDNSLSNVKLNRGVVDLSDYEIAEDLVVSPNPALDRIVVSLRHPQKGNNFEVYNGEGNKVSTVTIDNDNLVQEMDISILPKGLYVLRLFNGKSVYKKRFVVK